MAKTNRIRTHTNPFNFYQRLKPLNIDSVFEEVPKHLDFEVGFGRGRFLRDYASLFPDRGIIGAEVRKKAVELLEARLIDEMIHNAHLIHGSAEIILEDCFSAPIFEKIFIFHPDPWLKKSHYKRRIVQPEFLRLIAKRLLPKGRLYVSTDVESLWGFMNSSILDSRVFTPVEDEFWVSHYKTHWKNFSDSDDRTSYFQAFELKK